MEKIQDQITPGPWTAFDPIPKNANKMQGFASVIRVGEKSKAGNPIATVLMGGKGACHSDKESVYANARAISKVPEMLDIIEQLASAKEFDPCITLKGEAQDLLNELNNPSHDKH